FKDFRNAIATGVLIKFKARARQSHPRPWRNLKITAFDISVLNGELRNHFADYVVQVRAMSHVLQQRLVLLAQRHPVITMHVRNIEEVAVTPPYFVKDLVPLFSRN